MSVFNRYRMLLLVLGVMAAGAAQAATRITPMVMTLDDRQPSLLWSAEVCSSSVGHGSESQVPWVAVMKARPAKASLAC
ncbi:hypothetical protein [Xanthomonas axonopodis]|uniref:hypothetical protein n=1 Tax=Xanthomonas axonopodis TaxID=53413 RepID=UPI0035588C70